MATKTNTRNARRNDAGTSRWRYAAPALRVGEDRWQLTALAAAGQPDQPITDLATSVTWTDESADLTGAVQLQVPDMTTLHLNQGRNIRCAWAPHDGSPWERIWTMQVGQPQFSAQQRTWLLQMQTTLTTVNKGTQSYHFHRDARHRRGWTADQVAREVGGRTGLPLGRLAECTHLITNLAKHSAHPLDVVTAAYRMERVATGRLFFMYWDGALNILPLTHSPELLEFAGALLDANYQVQLNSNFATALTVRATAPQSDRRVGGRTVKAKRTQKKIYVTVTSPAGVKQFGYVHQTVDAPNALTAPQAAAWGRNQLAKVIKPVQSLDVTVPIRPTLRRGAAFKVTWPKLGLTQVVFVSSLQHSVTPGSRTTQITATFTDPVTDPIGIATAKKRARTARRRGRSHSSPPAPSAPTGSRSRRRSGG